MNDLWAASEMKESRAVQRNVIILLVYRQVGWSTTKRVRASYTYSNNIHQQVIIGKDKIHTAEIYILLILLLLADWWSAGVYGSPTLWGIIIKCQVLASAITIRAGRQIFLKRNKSSFTRFRWFGLGTGHWRLSLTIMTSSITQVSLSKQKDLVTIICL